MEATATWVQERITNAVYGVVVTSATMSVVSDKRWDDAYSTGGQVFATMVVIWLAHAYARAIAVSSTTGEPGVLGGTWSLLEESWPLVAAALWLLSPMVLVGADAISYETGLWISIGLAIAFLAFAGVIVARRRRLQAGQAVVVVVGCTSIGLLLIGLKAVTH